MVDKAKWIWWNNLYGLSMQKKNKNKTTEDDKD